MGRSQGGVATEQAEFMGGNGVESQGRKAPPTPGSGCGHSCPLAVVLGPGFVAGEVTVGAVLALGR